MVGKARLFTCSTIHIATSLTTMHTVVGGTVEVIVSREVVDEHMKEITYTYIYLIGFTLLLYIV